MPSALRRPLACAVAALTLAATAAHAAPIIAHEGYSLQIIDSAPSPTYGFAGAAINNAGHIAYGSSRPDTGVAYYRYDRATSAVQLVASQPNVTTPSLNDNGVLAWQFVAPGGAREVYTGTPATGRQLQFTSSGLWNGKFLGGASFYPDINNSNTLAFHTRTQNPETTYVVTKNPGTPNTTFASIVARTDDAVEPFNTFVESETPSINDAGNVAFAGAYDGGGFGVWHRTSAGTLSLLAGPTAARPSGYDATFGPSMNNLDEVVFSDGPELYYAKPGLAPQLLLSATNFSAVNIAAVDINDEGQIVFKTNGGGGAGRFDGIYVLDSFTDTTPQLVARAGTPLPDGGNINFLFFSRGGINNVNELAFQYIGNNNTTGILLATPVVPEPATLTLLPATALLLRRRQPR